MKIYIDGKLYPKEEAKISVYDHGLLYGDGVFEGIRVYRKGIFKLDEHLQRLYDSAKFIQLEIPMSFEEMRKTLIDVVRINLEEEDMEDAYIRLLVTRGVGDLGIDPRKCPKASVIIIVDKIQLYPKEFYENGLKVIISSWRRPPVFVLNPRVKSLNYLNNIMAKIEANEAGAQEAIMLDINGHVSECTADNVFIVKDNVLMTPPPFVGILEGITRNTVMDLAKEIGMKVEERILDLKDIFTADEMFLTGTAAEIVPVVEVAGRKIGTGKPGPWTKKLLETFRANIDRFLTPVYQEEKARA